MDQAEICGNYLGIQTTCSIFCYDENMESKKPVTR